MKHWLALIASILMQSCLGMVYAWSTFIPALEREHGITPERSGLIFGVCIASFTVSMVFGGVLQHKYGSRWVGMIGGALFFAGYLIGALSNGNFALMLTGFSVVAGAGIGFAYVCPLATGVQWFPKHKGLITGLTVAGFGLGSIFFATAGKQMLDANMPVLDILLRIGWIVGATVMVASLFLFAPSTAKPNTAAPETHAIRTTLKDRRFQKLFWQIFCGTFGGLLIIGNLKPMGMAEGLTAESATRAVMLFAIGNALGRILWGLWYDRFGATMITACLGLLAIGSVILGVSTTPLGFYLATFITAFAFGGCFVLFAARVADEFGSEHISEIYPFVFLGYGIAGLAGPPVGGWILARTGSPLIPGIAVLLVALAGAASSLRLPRTSFAANQP